MLDVMFYGASLTLEFIALAALRIREPNLPRPFRVPGGLAGAVLVGIEPIVLLVISAARSEHEEAFHMNALTFAAMMIAAGFAAYCIAWIFQGRPQPAEETAAADAEG